MGYRYSMEVSPSMVVPRFLSSISRWDFPWNLPSSDTGVPLFFGNPHIPHPKVFMGMQRQHRAISLQLRMGPPKTRTSWRQPYVITSTNVVYPLVRLAFGRYLDCFWCFWYNSRMSEITNFGHCCLKKAKQVISCNFVVAQRSPNGLPPQNQPSNRWASDGNMFQWVIGCINYFEV